MQVARLVEPRAERSLAAKLRQMVRAVQLERRLGKDGVLDLYLALAPYGGPVEGVRAASLAYFGREPAGSPSPRVRSSSPCRRRRKPGARTATRRRPGAPATGCWGSRRRGA